MPVAPFPDNINQGVEPRIRARLRCCQFAHRAAQRGVDFSLRFDALRDDLNKLRLRLSINIQPLSRLFDAIFQPLSRLFELAARSINLLTGLCKLLLGLCNLSIGLFKLDFKVGLIVQDTLYRSFYFIVRHFRLPFFLVASEIRA